MERTRRRVRALGFAGKHGAICEIPGAISAVGMDERQ
jgi:hypothetical protein